MGTGSPSSGPQEKHVLQINLFSREREVRLMMGERLMPKVFSFKRIGDNVFEVIEDRRTLSNSADLLKPGTRFTIPTSEIVEGEELTMHVSGQEINLGTILQISTETRTGKWETLREVKAVSSERSDEPTGVQAQTHFRAARAMLPSPLTLKKGTKVK